MTQAKANKEREVEDFDIPLHERADFKAWATAVVLPAIIKGRPLGTRTIRNKLGDRLGDERQFSLQMALDYLLLHEHIYAVEKHVTMYTTKKPKSTVRKIPKKDWNGDLIPEPTRPRVTPHFQQMGKKELA